MTSQQVEVAEAEEVLAAAVAAYQAGLGGRLLAAYALGSLAHGGFSPLVSDIDLGLVIADTLHPEDIERIELIAQRQKSSGRPLADRLSVFWGTPSTLAGRRGGGRFPPLDRLDLLESGRLLCGTDTRAGLARPAGAQLLAAGAEFALDYLAGIRPSRTGAQPRLGSMRPAGGEAIEEVKRPEALAGAGPRRLTKLVLFPVRFMFTAATKQVGSNHVAVDWYLARTNAPSKPLVAAALAWRNAEAPNRDEVAELLREHMVPLYLHYIDDHIERLEAIAEVALARAFGDWRIRLEN